MENISELSLENTNTVLNDRTPINYLGVGIFNTNYKTYLRENVMPKELYENEEYHFSFDELEKGRSEW